MSMLSDVEDLKKPRAEITVVGAASFEIPFVPPVGATITDLQSNVYEVTAVAITLAEGSDPAQVQVTVAVP